MENIHASCQYILIYYSVIYSLYTTMQPVFDIKNVIIYLRRLHHVRRLTGRSDQDRGIPARTWIRIIYTIPDTRYIPHDIIYLPPFDAKIIHPRDCRKCIIGTRYILYTVYNDIIVVASTQYYTLYNIAFYYNEDRKI